MVKIFKKEIIVKIFSIFLLFFLVLSPFSNSLVRADVCGEWGSPYCKESDPSSIFQSRTCTREKEVCEYQCVSYYSCCQEWGTRTNGACYWICYTPLMIGCGVAFWWCPLCLAACLVSADALCGSGCQETYCVRYGLCCSETQRVCHTETETYTEEKFEECSPIDTSESKCIGDWMWEKYSTTACQDNACVPISDFWQEKTNCAATCFPEILKQGCESGTYTCDPGTGKCALPYQSCKPPQYTSSGTACECNTGLGTVTKVCNGSGNCIETEEKCHTGCGAVGACHGLKSGDLNPENPALKCCKGGEWLPKWKETAP